MRANLTDLSVQRLKPTERQFIVWDTNLPAFGVKVSARTKSFVVKVGAKLTTIGRYPDMALKEARTNAKAAQVAKTSEGAPRTIKTYPEAVLAFLEAKKGQITLHSHKCYTRYLNVFTFTGPVHAITKADIREQLKTLSGKPHAQNFAFITMRTLMNWCLQEEIIDRHPMHRSSPPNKVPSRERVLTDDELRKVWNAATDFPYGNIVRILMLTGQRREEVAALKDAPDVLTFSKTKNGTTHTLPITPLVREHLALPFNFKRWSAYKEKLDKASGVTNWRLHDLRRTCASNMAKLKVSPHVIEKVLNHQTGIVSGIAAVYNRYSYREEVEDALLTYEAYLIRIINAQGTNPEPSTALPQESSDEVFEQA